MEAASRATPNPGTIHRVYEISRNFGDLEHYKEGERSQWDAYLIEFPGSDDVEFWKPQPLSLPEPVEFDAQTDVLGSVDYFTTAPTWPVMSKRMLNVLLSVREFPHQVIPLVMHETPVLSEDVVMAGRPYIRTGKVNHDYVAVQLLEQLDIFDYENSVYRQHPLFPEVVDPNSIEKLVLKEPKSGFPPLFRISVDCSIFHVSAEARAALEVVDIRGVRFIELSGSY